MKITKQLLALALILSASMGIIAQNAMTPYSRYGYGILQDNATSAQRAMGGVGYAMNSGRQINVMNPASYASIDSLTFLFDMGISASALWSEENGKKGKDFGGGLDYITMQFPISKYLGGSIGILPFSSVGYSFGNEVLHGTNSRQGSGGLNQLYAGVSGRVFNKLNLGVNVSYLFGTTINDIYANTSTGATTLFERVMQVRDWRLQFGAQYTFDISTKNSVTIGAVFSPGKSLLGKTWGMKYDINQDEAPDTIGYTSTKGKYSLPASWGFGVNYEWNKRLIAEVDFTYQAWKDAKYSALENFEKSRFDNRWEIAAGVQYTPKPRGNYIQRIQYRMGGFYNHDYLMVNDNNIREFGITAGLGLPVNGFKTILNLGFEYRHRQANPEPLIKEDFFNITLGINFNEMWFWKNKIR
ncbi:MAG: hypothetical protein E7081_02310 [Bacteroidales bacterium]|nr:hypothetical protein [Bacteroidales bacterium]